jgi:hypothetical protein
MLMSTIQFSMASIPGHACAEPTAEIDDFDILSTKGYLRQEKIRKIT